MHYYYTRRIIWKIQAADFCVWVKVTGIGYVRLMSFSSSHNLPGNIKLKNITARNHTAYFTNKFFKKTFDLAPWNSVQTAAQWNNTVLQISAKKFPIGVNWFKTQHNNYVLTQIQNVPYLHLFSTWYISGSRSAWHTWQHTAPDCAPRGNPQLQQQPVVPCLHDNRKVLDLNLFIQSFIDQEF